MDVREALEAASQKIESTPEPAPEPAPREEAPPEPAAAAESKPAEPTAASEARGRDDKGRFAPKAADAAAAKAGVEAKPDSQPATPPPAPPDAPKADTRAPQSWKPAVREKFATLPPEVQEEVVRRERDAARLAQENAQLRQSAGRLDELVRPYESAIRAQGQEPAAYVGSVLQTAHVVFNGPPQHRAAALAEIIVNAGVPPELLDGALAARLGGQGSPAQPMRAPAPQEFRDPRLDQLLAERQQRAQADAETQAAKFAETHEFYADVAPMMSNVLEAMARNGQRNLSTEDLERVYTAACLAHPDVAPVFEQRRAAEAAAKARASTQRTLAAASSVRSSPAAAATAQPKGERAALAAAAEKIGW